MPLDPILALVMTIFLWAVGIAYTIPMAGLERRVRLKAGPHSG